MIAGGLRIPDRIAAVGGDVFAHAPCCAPGTGAQSHTMRSVHRELRQERNSVTPTKTATEGPAKRRELLLELPVSAPAKAPRHHGALRILPRGRRRRGRGARSGCGARQACMVAAGDCARIRRHAAASGGAGAGSRGSRVCAAAGRVRDDHRRHGDGPGAIALPRFPRARALLSSRGRRLQTPLGGNLRIPIRDEGLPRATWG